MSVVELDPGGMLAKKELLEFVQSRLTFLSYVEWLEVVFTYGMTVAGADFLERLRPAPDQLSLDAFDQIMAKIKQRDTEVPNEFNNSPRFV